jgi:RimJ/RimL family protein N-acetyltransferase
VTYPLLTERLSIEPLALSDLEPFVKYRQNPEVARYQSWDGSYSVAQGRELIESQAGLVLPESGQWLQLAIHDRKSGTLIGDLAIHSLENELNCFEIGFTLANQFQRRGYGKEAAERLLEHLVTQAGAKKFIATPDSRNQASIRLLLALGFEQRQEKAWTEEFKGETVAVFYFEKT